MDLSRAKVCFGPGHRGHRIKGQFPARFAIWAGGATELSNTG